MATRCAKHKLRARFFGTQRQMPEFAPQGLAAVAGTWLTAPSGFARNLRPAIRFLSRSNVQEPPQPSDKVSVSSLLNNARNIMDTAVDAERIGMAPSDWTIFFGPDGGLEMIAGTDTPLESLAWSRGARMAWQVKHHSGGVSVEGRAMRETCRFELDLEQTGAQVLPKVNPQMLLGTTSLYQLIQAA